MGVGHWERVGGIGGWLGERVEGGEVVRGNVLLGGRDLRLCRQNGWGLDAGTPHPLIGHPGGVDPGSHVHSPSPLRPHGAISRGSTVEWTDALHLVLPPHPLIGHPGGVEPCSLVHAPSPLRPHGAILRGSTVEWTDALHLVLPPIL